MANTKTSTMVAIRVPNEMHAELAKVAERERRSVSWILKEAATEFLKRDARQTALKKRKTP